MSSRCEPDRRLACRRASARFKVDYSRGPPSSLSIEIWELDGLFAVLKPEIHPLCASSVQLAGARLEKIGAASICARGPTCAYSRCPATPRRPRSAGWLTASRLRHIRDSAPMWPRGYEPPADGACTGRPATLSRALHCKDVRLRLRRAQATHARRVLPVL